MTYFKVVQGHVFLAHQSTRDPLAIVGFLVIVIFIFCVTV